jgi:glycosyltransferase involved in cell wall biosynthesis
MPQQDPIAPHTGVANGGASAPEITVITPMYNEAGNIQANVRKILTAMEGLGVSWEYILVDDGSTDTGLEEARELISDNPACRIVHYSPNRGRGYALRQGFAAARGRHVITTESDLSWGPDIIRLLYERLVQGDCDIVVASVHLPGGGLVNVPPARRWLSSYGNLLMRWCYGGKLTMLSGMTRAYRREAITSLHLESCQKEIHVEILAKAKALGMRIVEIPAHIRWEKQGPGRKRSNIAGMAKFIIPHLADSYNFGATRILTWGTVGLFTLGCGVIAFGTLNKLFLLTSTPKPNLVIYGLVLVLLAGLGALFAGLSLQIGSLSRSITHVQTQLERMSRELAEMQAEERNADPHADHPPPPKQPTRSPDEHVSSTHGSA